MYNNLFLEFSSAALNDSTITSTPLSYEDWLPLWTQHLTDTPEVSAVPPSACEINTPLNTQNWHKCLCRHPNQELVSYYLKGLSAGFRIGLCTPVHSLHSAHKNLQGALLHTQVVDDYLQTELSLGRISGPFQKSQCSTVQISRFGVIPKHHQPNKWRLIVDLSHPTGHSVNDYIPKALYSLSYITVDHAIYSIIQSGPNTLLAKVDIKSAFRLIPVHPADRAYFDIILTASHIAGTANTLADQLSRNNMTNFFKNSVNMCRLPTPIPPYILEIVSPDGPDWTSPTFRELFSASIHNYHHYS